MLALLLVFPEVAVFMETKFIMISSSKGGVGKSTVALGISKELALLGESVLLCDLDFGNACQDILLGVEDRVIYTVSDIAKGKCRESDAIVSDLETGISGLVLLPCPAGATVRISENEDDGGLSPKAVIDAVKKAAAASSCRYVVIDTGAGVNALSDAAAEIANSILVVASHNPISLRAAEGTVVRYSKLGLKDIRLVINSFEADSTFSKKYQRKSLLDIIDLSRAQLLGVVPYDYALMLSHEGLLMKERSGKAGDSDRAFYNIARRIMGDDVPLFMGIKKLRRARAKLYQ